MKHTLTIVVLLALVGAAAKAMMSNPNETRDLGPVTTHRISRGDLSVTITEQGTLESSNNLEIKNRVRGENTIIQVVESGIAVERGHVLIRLETLGIEEEISERTKFRHLASSQVARSKADVERARLAISAYIEGDFVSQLSTLEKNLAVAESQLRGTKNRLAHTRMMAKSEYKSELEVEEREFAVSQAELRVGLTQTNINVLKKFTKEEQLATLRGELKAAEATFKADVEREQADEKRLNRALEELEFCAITADRAGMVIYPNDKQWEDAPDIEEGATVHKDQTLLLMPDLTQMQVKVGIHESVIDRVEKGMIAGVTIPGRTLEGKLTYVASVAEPAGWWTGNVVKYETIVSLPTSTEGLKPGMSVEVKIIVAEHNDVVMIPTAAVIETTDGHACWVQTASGPDRRKIEIGDSDDMYIVVTSGVSEGDDVVLDPLTYVEEAQLEAARMLEQSR